MAQAKSIKGITIEIAGDTTKLSKALKGVDDTSKELASNLKRVDKLLDMDPGNTELLVEKYEALSPAIALASAKLETLKEVQGQIERQYRDGDIGQGAYLDFRAELMRTEKRLADLRDESHQVENALQGTGDEARDTAGDLDRLGGGAKNAAGELDDMDGVLSTLIKGGKFVAIGAAIKNTVDAVGDIVQETEEYREEQSKLDIAFESSKLTAEDAEIAYRNVYRVLGETDQAVEASQQIALLADSTKDVTRWARVAPGLVARFGDALQPETFYESANETLKLGEATGAYVQLLEATGVITVDDFNARLQSLNDEEAKQQYMLGVTEQLLGDAAAAYEERNETVLAARDADREWQDSLALLGESFSPVVTAAKDFGTDIVNWFVPKVQTGVDMVGAMSTGFSDMCTEMKTDWEEVSVWFEEHWTGFTDGLRDVTEAINETFTDTVDATDLAEQQLGQNTAAMTTIVDELSEDMSLAAYGVYDPWIGAGATVADVCDGMAQSYDEAVTYISKQKWSIPTPKVPEFSVRGAFALNPPSVPKFQVAWNATGGIFSKPMILPAMDGSLQGFGEAGREAILPLDSFYSQLEDILTRRVGGGTQLVVDVNIEHFDNSSGQDPREFAWAVMDELNVKLQQKGAAIG